jgi:HK97 gp10 family phage protein
VASVKTTIRVEGLRELKAALDELPKATGTNILKRALTEAGQPVARDAAAAAPDDPETGGYDLRTSIKVGTRLSRRQRKRLRKESKVEVYIGAGPLPQAHLQEFGTAHHGPQPFMRPAFDSNKRGMVEAIKASLWREIDKARARLARKSARLAGKV